MSKDDFVAAQFHHRTRNGTFLNHGSFGCPSLLALEAKTNSVAEMTGNSDEFILTKSGLLNDRGCELMASFVNTSRDNVVLVPNTTTGIWSILLSAVKAKNIFGYKLKICAIGCTYGAMKRQLEMVKALCDCTITSIDASKYIEMSGTEFNETLISKLKEVVVNDSINIALIDFISSDTAQLLPVKELCRFAKENNIMTIIDAAHAAGQVKLDVEDLGCDFLVSNIHKWMYSPIGCAVLYKSPSSAIVDLGHAIPSHGYEMGMLVEFSFGGTADDVTTIAAIPAVFNFAECFGGWDALMKRNHDFAVWGLSFLFNLWWPDGSGFLRLPESSVCMGLVQFPKKMSDTLESLKMPRLVVMNAFRRVFKTSVFIYTFMIDGKQVLCRL